jgi:hypothetical protein
MKTFHTTIKKLYKIISWEEAAAPSEYKPWIMARNVGLRKLIDEQNEILLLERK